MRLEKEFVVGAPLDQVWPALKDPGVLAACLPGAELQPRDNLFAGRVELTANGHQIRCDATLQAVDADEDDHVATVVVHGRQLGGPAIGSATVRSRCEPADSSTKVTLTAELSSSGHADPGTQHEAAAREVFEQAADQLRERAAATPAAAAPAPSPEPPPSEPQTLSTPRSAQTPRQRGLVAAGGALAGGAVLGALLARRRGGGRRKGLW